MRLAARLWFATMLRRISGKAKLRQQKISLFAPCVESGRSRLQSEFEANLELYDKWPGVTWLGPAFHGSLALLREKHGEYCRPGSCECRLRCSRDQEAPA